MPMFDLKDPAGHPDGDQQLPQDLPEPLHPRDGVRQHARLWKRPRMSFIVNRPKNEPGLRPGAAGSRTGAQIRYTIHSYATDKPEGERY